MFSAVMEWKKKRVEMPSRCKFARDRTKDRMGMPNENFSMNARKYLDRVAGRLLPKLTAEGRIKIVAGPLFVSL